MEGEVTSPANQYYFHHASHIRLQARSNFSSIYACLGRTPTTCYQRFQLTPSHERVHPSPSYSRSSLQLIFDTKEDLKPGVIFWKDSYYFERTASPNLLVVGFCIRTMFYSARILSCLLQVLNSLIPFDMLGKGALKCCIATFSQLNYSIFLQAVSHWDSRKMSSVRKWIKHWVSKPLHNTLYTVQSFDYVLTCQPTFAEK